MGLCASNQNELSQEEAAARRNQLQVSKEIDVNMSRDHNMDQQINKLLLLGAGESGKSTLFKQMIQIYGKGFPEAERRGFISVIHNNIITSMKTLSQQSVTYGPVGPEAEEAKRFVDNELKGDEEVDEKVAAAIKTLWSDPGIRATFDNRSKFQLMDSSAYFFDRVDEIAEKGYIPSEQDIFRCRVRTTGILENDFVINGNQFKMVDVGGQRNERKKWIHCFEDVRAVIFVAAISEYDQLCYEDDRTNRMVEALNLFEEIANSRWFNRTSIILFLNKRDLFADKLKKVPLRDYFPEYEGDNSFDSAAEFLRDQFLKRNRNPDKQIYTHITCATDTGNVAAVFNAVKDIVIRIGLAAAGLV